jgi:GxxExxY protein
MNETIIDRKEMIMQIINAGVKVHKALGFGLFREVYEECLIYELLKQDIKVEKQKRIPLTYEGLEFSNAFEIDIIVEDTLIVGLRPANIQENIYYKYIQTYAKHCNLAIGIIFDFHVDDFRSGIRIVQKKSAKPTALSATLVSHYYKYYKKK